MNKTNIIIFGGAGFIGSHFKNYFDRNHYNILSYDIAPQAEDDIFGDVRETISLNHVSFHREDIIINLAAIHRMPGHEDHEYYDTNLKGARNVCDFAREKGIDNIIFTSSIAPYGASEDLKTEETPPAPNTPYGTSKLQAEEIHREWQAEDSSRKLLIIRPGVVYGKGEKGNNTRLYKALKSGKFFYPGRKDTVKANIYVKDLVQLTMEIFNSYPHGVKLYNFTYEPAYTIKEIVEAMSAVIGKKPPRLVISGPLMILGAKILGAVGFSRLGIHPERIKKLMVSTNISGKKILQDGYKFKYTLQESLDDWFKDCDKKGLF